ncbi:hypothetical protein Bca4012_076317 [Brassica carinata]
MACSYDSMAWYEIHISSSTSCSFVNILVLHQAGARDKLAVTGTSSSSKKTISPTSSTLGWKIRNIQPNGDFSLSLNSLKISLIELGELVNAREEEMGEWTKALDMRVAALEEKDVDAKNKMEALDMIVTALEVYVEKVGEDSPEDSPQDVKERKKK